MTKRVETDTPADTYQPSIILLWNGHQTHVSALAGRSIGKHQRLYSTTNAVRTLGANVIAFC